MKSSEMKYLRIFETGRYSNLLHLSDGKLSTDDGCTFDIHRIILAEKNEYFHAMFSKKDQDRREFIIPGISGECLSDILCYLYTGDICINEKNITDLLIAADYLLVKDIQRKITQSIKNIITDVNCFRIFQVSHQVNEDTSQECFRFIQTRFDRLMRSRNDDIASLPLEMLKIILHNGSLYVHSESTVWQAIVEWTERDIQSRSSRVPDLLLCLAKEEMDEKLATEIVHHEIVSNNACMKSLNRIKASNDSTSNLDILLNSLRNHFSDFTVLHRYRIPEKLHVIIDDSGWLDGYRVVYITYDENLDLWRKITELYFRVDMSYAIPIGHKIYMFVCMRGLCVNFDLHTLELFTVRNLRDIDSHRGFRVVAIEKNIYILYIMDFEWNDVEIYDTVNDMWFDGVALHNIKEFEAVTNEKTIFVVGFTKDIDGMITQMFDPVTQKWSLLSPPNIISYNFHLLAYDKKIYLIETKGEDCLRAEVFDLATNLWKKLPDLPYIYECASAIVLNDQIIVYETDVHYRKINKNNVRWNRTKGYWEKLEERNPLQGLKPFKFCTIDDVETIKMFTKQNRDQSIQMEESLLNK